MIGGRKKGRGTKGTSRRRAGAGAGCAITGGDGAGTAGFAVAATGGVFGVGIGRGPANIDGVAGCGVAVPVVAGFDGSEACVWGCCFGWAELLPPPFPAPPPAFPDWLPPKRPRKSPPPASGVAGAGAGGAMPVVMTGSVLTSAGFDPGGAIVLRTVATA